MKDQVLFKGSVSCAVKDMSVSVDIPDEPNMKDHALFEGCMCCKLQRSEGCASSVVQKLISMVGLC